MIQTSIIIVNYNTFQLTSQCIKSIYNKEDRQGFEIILVDNASTECDPNKFTEQFPSIILIVSNTNLGFAGGNNLGIKQAKGKYILLLNSDTELLNDAVNKAASIMEQQPDIGVLSGQLQYPDGRLQGISYRFPSLKKEIREFFRINKFLSTKQRAFYYLGNEWDYTQAIYPDWVCGAFFMFLKDDLEYFPNKELHADFFMYFEDVQWCYYFRKHLNKFIYYTPEPKAIHYIGGSDQKIEAKKWKYFNTILPNEYKWMKKEKGWIYTKLYYLFKALHHFSLRKKANIEEGKAYIKFIMQ